MNNEYIVYQLSDPAETDIPSLVSWGPSPRPWIDLWERKCGLEPRVAAWFQSLRRRNLTPVVGFQMGVSTMSGANQFVRWRVQQINDWAGGDASWLLNDLRRQGKGKQVVRDQDGGTVRYSSVSEASRQTGSCREDISRWARSGCRGSNGSAWYFDYTD